MNRDEALDDVTAMVAGLLPGIPATAVRTVADRAGAGAICNVRAHLRRHPDALTSGDGRIPAGVMRLAVALRELGAAQVVVPACADCGQHRPLDYRRPDQARICTRCSEKRRVKLCSRCGELGRLQVRLAEGGLCSHCYRTDPARRERCADCGKAKHVATRRPDGTVLCSECYQPPQHTCGTCRKVGPAKAFNEAGALCKSCYQRAPRACGGCGQQRQIVIRARDGRPDLCASCYNGPIRTCSSCGKDRPCRGLRTGRYLCLSCAPRSQDTCALCHRMAGVKTRWPLGPVCQPCYSRTKRHPGECPLCTAVRPLIGLDTKDRRICGPCAGTDKHYSCATCGNSGDNRRKNQCHRCAMPDELRAAFGQTACETFLAPLVDALQQVGNPPAVMNWLHRENSGAALLRELLASGYPLTHELLDTFPNRVSALYLRNLLVQSEILPTRDERMAQAEAWMNRVLEAVPDRHRLILQPYATWVVLRRVRQRARDGRLTASGASHARTQINCARNFLAWVDSLNLQLRTVTQTEVDWWIADGATSRLRLRDFLRWTSRTRLSQDLFVPGWPDSEPVNFLDQDEHIAQLTRCVNDAGLPADVRAAGALVLLYGVRVTRISQLKAEHIRQTSDGSSIELGASPVLMPPAVEQLVTTQAEAARRYQATQPGSTAERWLFPSPLPGRPASAHRLSMRLVEHGIEVRSARNTALSSLADDLPAPVIADLLGLHINTAERWSKLAKRDWTGYLEARATELR
ncbi:hypothetical protein ACIA8O_11965 [Kitasatospora sp. NPDC051853]|uniref:hypothetical protein n=1 Tax=Kitasatospora sp. NPDC051853 TaxID=3364058 RepID=UPI0037BDE4BD